MPVDHLEWHISQEMANSIVATLANTIGAAESVLKVTATGHDKKLCVKVVFTLYFLAALGRVVSGVAVAYAALCIFCLYMFAQSTDLFDQVPIGRDLLGGAQDTA
uniref:Reticulon domain-containing protein n=1 Tax=Arundo donax TaxID=35708 RepID=A0A0A9GAD0_ARUDO